MKRILAIDDDEAILSYLTQILETRYEVVVLSNPEQAGEIASDLKPDLIMCDINMPKMNGGQVRAELLANSVTQSIPFLYLTAMVSPAETQRMEGIVGGEPGVAKRAPREELLKAVATLLSE